MSYCVNCGVELGKDLKECPLCHTPVINPNAAEETREPFFPTRQEEIAPVSKMEAGLLLTAMLASVALCCGLLNIVFRPDTFWSLYAAGAALMLWIWFVLPLMLRKMPGWPKLAIDLCAVALYVFLIALACGGMEWYVGLALPLLLTAAVITLAVCWLLRGGRCSILSSIVICLVACGIMSVAAELFFDSYLFGLWHPGWSLIVLAVCLGLSIPLIIVRRVPSLREEARRRFHL